MDDFKENVLSQSSAPRSVVQAFCKKVNTGITAVMPSITSLMSNMSRTRKAHATPEVINEPKTLDEIIIIKEDILTSSGEPFLLADHYNSSKQNRTIIFGSSKLLKFLFNCKSWYMDGTFDVAPRFFTQMYTIHGELINLQTVSVLIYKTYLLSIPK